MATMSVCMTGETYRVRITVTDVGTKYAPETFTTIKRAQCEAAWHSMCADIVEIVNEHGDVVDRAVVAA